MLECLFCRIIAGEVPSNKLYEDDEVYAFHDIHPIAPVHFMIIPKSHVDSLQHCGPEYTSVLGKILLLAPKLAVEQELTDGFKIGINTGRGGGQEVFHLHIHVFGAQATRGYR